MNPTPKPFAELTSFLEEQAEPYILLDDHYRILAANAAYRRAFSPNQSVVGRMCYEVSHRYSSPCDQNGETCPLARARASGRRERVLHLHHTPKGEAHVNIELTPLRNAAGAITLYVEKTENLRRSSDPDDGAKPLLIGRSPAFMAMLELVARVGPSMATVLLLGESGTGKELVARAVHEASPRASKPLVAVDCSSLPETLFESELFGHERGAFTGAHAAHAGLVEVASGGTLFLDEVGDIPLSMQVKLLRLLETGTYRRVGSSELRRADIRVVSATHRNLEQMVRDGQFREDLYFRLSTFPIRLPPLRERAGDIALLAPALLQRVAPGRQLRISAEALALLQTQPWPGNVRELRNLLERAALLCDGSVIEVSHVQQALGMTVPAPVTKTAPGCAPRPAATAPAELPAAEQSGAATAPLDPNLPLRELELRVLRERLARHQGSRASLAAELGISERTLYRRLRALASGAPK
ncbi:MAG: sigma-54 interaction domain-containing protein [Tepidimonas sp.]|uniref:sigma-54 interaction domain-containing protein n=1 Tax=Tepidimonas sp. TaxID=2002775 RepID=UPI004054BD02